MEIEVSQDKLAKALNNVSRIAVGKVTLPVLNNVLVRVDDKKVSLITTNLDMAIVDHLPVADSKDGVTTIPARLLAEFVSTLPRGANVKLSAEGTKVTITSGKYSSVINGALADDFPELPEINEEKAVVFKMGVDEFKTGLTSVMVASSNDTARPALTGIYFHTANKTLSVAATDGYRLAEKKLIKDVQSEISVLVPSNSLQEVLRAISDDMEEIEISFNEDLVRFRLGEIEIISKLIDASFPDYERLIPKDSNINLVLNRDEVIRITKLASIFSRSVNGAIICETRKPNIFAIKAVASELGENESTIEIPEVEVEGRLSVNARFLADAVNALSSKEINFDFSNRMTPIVLHNKDNQDYTHIVMPINS